MAEVNVSASTCIACQRSLNRIGGTRRRSMTLTDEFMKSHPFLIPYCADIINVHQVSHLLFRDIFTLIILQITKVIFYYRTRIYLYVLF